MKSSKNPNAQQEVRAARIINRAPTAGDCELPTAPPESLLEEADYYCRRLNRAIFAINAHLTGRPGTLPGLVVAIHNQDPATSLGDAVSRVKLFVTLGLLTELPQSHGETLFKVTKGSDIRVTVHAATAEELNDAGVIRLSKAMVG